MRALSYIRYAVAGAALAAAAGCVPTSDPGEWGVVRYFAEVPGRVPMRLVPPVTDREGNIYVLHGNNTRPEAIAYVGRESGGWVEGCDIHKGDSRGIHGWVGTAQSRAWYWSGDALVEVAGSGSCRQILDRDPTTRSSLLFQAVFPWIQEQPSQVRASAILQSPGGAPFHVTIDLDLGQYETISEFQPGSAENIDVAGVGANPDRGELYALIAYDFGGERVVEGRIMSFDGEVLYKTEIPGLTDLTKDAVFGYLESRGGRVAAVLDDGRLVEFGGGESEVHGAQSLAEIDAIGVHARGGKLWVVGTRDGRPALAEIGDQGVGPALVWQSSERAAESLRGAIPVRDEREEPYVYTEWTDPDSAIGRHPFVSPFTPEKYAEGMTGWLLAGPAFDNAIEGRTAVAFSPVGISYP